LHLASHKTILLLKYVGDWLSDCYLLYNEMSTEQMKLLPTLMAAKMKQVSASPYTAPNRKL